MFSHVRPLLSSTISLLEPLFNRFTCAVACISLLVVVIFRRFWSNRPLPFTTLPSKVLFVIAHPDDETMFFAPTISELTRQGHRVFLLSVSTGDFYGQGQLRVKELREAVQFLGINASDVSILDYDKFKDGYQWDHLELSDLLLKQIKLLDAEVIISFDDGGVSHHSNHISIFDALQELYSRGDLPINTQVFCLDTVNVLRKYVWLFDFSISICQSPFCYFATMRSFFAAWRAMREHRSQLLWFRYLYVLFSRYLVINTYRRIAPLIRIPKQKSFRKHENKNK